MAYIQVDLTSTGNGYTATNTLGEIMVQSGTDGSPTFNIYTGGAGGTLVGTVQCHGGHGPVSIPFNHTIRNATGTTNVLSSINTTPYVETTI